MGFSQNNKAAANSGGIKPEGDYEVIITSIEERTNRNNKTSLNIRLTIRNDIEEQKYGNACLFYSLWRVKEPTPEDLAVGGYKFSFVMGIGKAAKLPDGKEYKDLEEYCGELIGKCVIAHVVHEIGTDNVTREKVKYLNETKYPDCKHKFRQTSDDTVAPQKNTGFAAAAVAATQSPIAEQDSDDDDDYPF